MRPRAAHEVPLLTATANRVIDLEDPIVASGSSGTPSTVERSPLDFDNEDHALSLPEGAGVEEHVQEGLTYEIPPVETATTTEVVQEAVHEEEVAATEPPVNKRRKQMHRKRVNEEAEANAPPKVLRKDHASGLAHSTRGEKSIAAMGLDAGSTFSPPAAQNTPTAVSDLEPLSSSKGAAAKIPTEDVATTEVNVQLSMGKCKRNVGAIKSRFGVNDESKKMQKIYLKQQFEGFSVSNTEGLHKGYDRFQSLLSQLEIHGAGVLSTEDAKTKVPRSLLSAAWSEVPSL
ncbi:hypothetical protein Tco_1244513 [Tanacetum coccineum]